MPQKKLHILPPLKGYAETSAYVAQPEGTVPHILNVSLMDPATERFRLAQRPGAGWYDLYDFTTGQTVNTPTLTLSGSGGGTSNTTGNPIAININRRDCWDVTSSILELDIHVVNNTAQCGAATIVISGPPNTDTSGSTSGTVTIEGNGSGGGGGGGTGGGSGNEGSEDGDTTGGTGGGFNWGCGGCTTPTTTTTIPIDWGDGGGTEDPDRPWLRLADCTSGTLQDLWVYQTVIGTWNSLPAVQLIATSDCYAVSGQRAAEPDVSQRLGSDEYNILADCDSCSESETCYYQWTCTFDCTQGTTAGWGAVTEGVESCRGAPDAPEVGTWTYSGRTGSDKTYVFWKSGGLCAENADCDSRPTAPAAPAFVPPNCPEPDCLGDWPGRFVLSVTVSAGGTSCEDLAGDWTFVCSGDDGLGHPTYTLESGPGLAYESGTAYESGGAYYVQISGGVSVHAPSGLIFAVGVSGPVESLSPYTYYDRLNNCSVAEFVSATATLEYL